jgi:lipid-A-disaccharide synthase
VSEPRIFISAGEASGDLHGAALATAIRRAHPNAKLYGLAGPRMAEAGVAPIVEFNRLVVMGFVEVMSRLPFFISLRARVRRMLERDPPDLVIPIDYPGFNLRLTRDAHRAGVPVLYYIAPQLWAWRPERAEILASYANRVAVVFPQEEPFLREFGVEAAFVGHPLLDRLPGWEGPAEAILGVGADPDRPILGLLPGSRPQEVRRMLRPFLEVAGELVRRRPETQVIVSSAPQVPADYYREAQKFPVVADSVRVLRASTAVLTKSGTTTLQSALAGTPLVIAYRVHPLSFALARRLVSVENVGMVNLIAGDRIAPEHIQRLSSKRIADDLEPLLDSGSPERTRMLRSLHDVRARLGEPGAAERVTAMATEMLEQR